MKEEIFERVRLRPSQLRTVAERRFGDAQYLRNSNRNERANGVMYLAGFVIECLLKAKLLERHKWLGTARTASDLEPGERELWSLCYRSHELAEILHQLPELERRLASVATNPPGGVLRNLNVICSSWTIFARYSPKQAKMKDAANFLDRVKELKEWLK